MAYTYRELKGLSDKEVEDHHDEHAPSAHPGFSWYRDELNRREEDKRLRTMVMLAWVIAGLTLANTALVAFALGE
jgi:hypothetical protein